jgi:hypothetical protein
LQNVGQQTRILPAAKMLSFHSGDGPHFENDFRTERKVGRIEEFLPRALCQDE